ncbi:integration host factor subunit alpha [Novosphingobium sp. P6W]|uniref:integration host factor subunit alpha n=1 Tax=Novosphingobium sp. P6W TaxID=1609758 RepID=UPI0035174A9C
MRDTLTKAEIAHGIHRKVGISRTGSQEMVEAILAAMGSAMERGENVKITGFGTFQLRDKGARVGRNPKTGEEKPISPRRVLTFKACNRLKEQVAGAPGPKTFAEGADRRSRGRPGI